MKNKSIHLIELQIGMWCIATSGALGRYIQMPPPLTIWWRAVFALCFLGLYCWWKGFRFDFKDAKSRNFVLLSGVFMAAHWVTYFYALQFSNVAVGMLCLFTYPVLTALIEPLLLKTKFEPIQLLLALIVLVGIYFLVPDFNLENEIFIGVLFGIASAVVYALRNLILKTQVSNMNGSVLMFYQMVVSVTILFPVLLVYSSPDLPKYIPYILTLGLVTTAIGHTLFLNSFRHFSITTASIMSSVQPIYGILIAMLFLQEYPDARSLIGGALILLTVIVESLRTARA